MDNDPDYFAALMKAGRIKNEGGKLVVAPKGSREIHDPFLNKTVEISCKLTDRLRGKYANGPTMPNGEPEFGWREFPSSPIQKEAADEIERLDALLTRAIDALNNSPYMAHMDLGCAITKLRNAPAALAKLKATTP